MTDGNFVKFLLAVVVAAATAPAWGQGFSNHPAEQALKGELERLRELVEREQDRHITARSALAKVEDKQVRDGLLRGEEIRHFEALAALHDQTVGRVKTARLTFANGRSLTRHDDLAGRTVEFYEQVFALSASASRARAAYLKIIDQSLYDEVLRLGLHEPSKLKLNEK